MPAPRKLRKRAIMPEEIFNPKIHKNRRKRVPESQEQIGVVTKNSVVGVPFTFSLSKKRAERRKITLKAGDKPLKPTAKQPDSSKTRFHDRRRTPHKYGGKNKK